MNYAIKWEKHIVRLDYKGSIGNRDIENAHVELNLDERFYDCHDLVINISQCNLENVSIEQLPNVVALDLGASLSKEDLTVYMVVSGSEGLEKARHYEKMLRSYGSPWEVRILPPISNDGESASSQ